jgi:peptidoglycan-associated lipoprotein
MKLNKINFIEKFVLVTFPVALAVGCTTTTDQHSKTASEAQTTLSQPSKLKRSVNSHTAALSDAVISGDAMSDQPNTNVAYLKTSTDIEAANTVYKDNVLEVKVRHVQANVDEKPVKTVFRFPVNKYDISGADLEILRKHAHYLKTHSNLTLYVDGFSDNRGPALNNYQLSKKRAKQVADLLKSYGAPHSRIKISGYGESFPVNNENNWDENRRVELEYVDTALSNEMIASYK